MWNWEEPSDTGTGKNQVTLRQLSLILHQMMILLQMKAAVVEMDRVCAMIQLRTTEIT